MELERANSRLIDEQAKQLVLGHFEVNPSDCIGIGTESEVYKLSGERVLKIYSDVTRYDKLMILKSLYSAIDYSALPYRLPDIHDVQVKDGLSCVIETFIPGQTLEQLLGEEENIPKEQAYKVYLDTVLALGAVRLKIEPEKYLLFDATDKSAGSNHDWYRFIVRLSEVKIERNKEALLRWVDRLDNKVTFLRSMFLDRPYKGEVSLLHGDYHPGNVMVDGLDQVTGVIDFGSFTMFGDKLYDIALACSFYDMYGAERDEVRDDLVDKAISTIGEPARVEIYRYMMAYALFSCDLYVEKGESITDNGHFQWARDLLNSEKYWNVLGLDT